MNPPNGECPVAEGFRFVGTGPLPSGFQRYDTLQDRSPIWRVDEPEGSYWMVLDRELVVKGLQDTDRFSSAAITPLDPDPIVCMKPVQLDPPEHTKWRKLLAAYFSPKRIELLEERILERCRSLVGELVPTRHCDFVADFALRFPTVIFLEIVGLPINELQTFLSWEAMVVHPDGDGRLDRDRQTAGMMAVMERFQQEIAERRAHPDPNATDIISHASAEWTIDGQPVADVDILECCLLLFLAGLDTVANELAMAFHHLASHPRDRARLVDDPSTAPAVAEELLRAYSIPQLARKVRHDTEFGGCRMSAGEMVMFSLAAANRDPKVVERGRDVVLERPPMPHYAFGAGPHRCLGSHLARKEITIALTKWHAQIPDYSLATDEPIREHRGAVHGVSCLPLQW